MAPWGLPRWRGGGGEVGSGGPSTFVTPPNVQRRGHLQLKVPDKALINGFFSQIATIVVLYVNQMRPIKSN